MNVRLAVLLSILFLSFTAAAAQPHSTDGGQNDEDYTINISEQLPGQESYIPLNWTEADVVYRPYKENQSSREDAERSFPETSGQKGFVNSLGGLYSVLLEQFQGGREEDRSSIDKKIHKEDFNSTGNFDRIHWNRYSDSGDLFTFASTEEWEYLLKNGDILEQSRDIENVQVTDDSVFYTAYSHGTNKELIYDQETLTEINREDGISDVASHNGEPVYALFDADQGSRKLYKNDQVVYRSINGSIKEIYNANGRLVFSISQKGGEYLLAEERKYGPVDDLVDVAYTGERFCVTEITDTEEKENEVVHCGDEKISQQAETGELHILDGQPVFLAEKSSEGDPSAKDHIIVDGESVVSHRKILRLEVGKDRFYYTAFNQDGTQSLYDIEGEIERFSAVNDLEIIDGRPATAVRSGGDWKIYFNGSTVGSGFENIFQLGSYRDKPVYVGQRDGKELLMHGDQEVAVYTDLDISTVSSDGNSLSYSLDNLSQTTFGYNGEEGKTLETEYPAQFLFYGSIDGEPLYGYWAVREGPDYDDAGRKTVLLRGDKVLEKSVELHNGAVIDDRAVYSNEHQIMLLDSFTSRKFDEIKFDLNDVTSHAHNPFIHDGEIVYTSISEGVSEDRAVTAYRGGKYVAGPKEDLSQLEIFKGSILALGVSREDFEGDVLRLGGEPVIDAGSRWGPVIDREIFSKSARRKLQNEINPGKGNYKTSYSGESSFMRLYSDGKDRFAASIKTEEGRTRYNKLAVFEENRDGKLDVSIEQIGYSELKGSGYEAEREHFDYQQVLDGKFIGDEFVFWSSGWNPYRTAVYSDGSFGETYQDIGRIFDVGGNVAYTAYENDTWYLVKEGDQVASSSSEFENLKVIDERLTYRAGDTLHHGNETYSYESIGEFREIGGELAFIYSENNSNKLRWGGETIESVEADIKHLNEKDGKPLYLVDYFNRKEIVHNGDKVAEIPSGSEVFTDEGMIGYRVVEEHEGRNAKLVMT